jgi:Flp pilus assembly protein TadG
VNKLAEFLLRKTATNSVSFRAAEPSVSPGDPSRLFGRLLRDTRASVMIIAAISTLALATAAGVGVDFARGNNFKQALQGAADTAAIAGASVYLNAGYATQATTAATNYLTTAVTHLPANNGVTTSVSLSGSSPFTVTVNASASINSTFNALIQKTIAVSVMATANGPSNPNIDFYMLLDSSPSMGIAATQSGINTMVANTSTQGGCAFACHETHPSTDNLGNPGGEDNYTLARNLGVALRIDNVTTATKDLMTTASSTSASNSAVYRVALYTFDVAVKTIQSLTSNLTTAKTSAGNIAQLSVYSNNYLTSSNNNSDTDTNFDTAFNTLNSAMPTPGNGTNATGDTPQEVLFMVTDGVEDEMVNGSRVQSVINTSMCNTIKNRGIRIAVLYTVYYPLPTNSWYNTYIAPFQSTIGTTLQSCASPGLYFQVSTGGDISAAMTALFDTAVQSAYLSQ